MHLIRLLDYVTSYDLKGNPNQEITGLAYDSRLVKKGYLFVALRGNTENGHDYIEEAVKNGAVVIVAEDLKRIDTQVTSVKVENSRVALSKIALRYFGVPFQEMNLIGITGTNGKTTTSYILESILHAAGGAPGVIGTINYRFSSNIWPAQVTTPESFDLMRILRKMADGGITDVIMEVSSHALDQGRVADCPFRVAIFTNISRDHLDYHRTMTQYFDAKSLLFKGLGCGVTENRARAAINVDDPKGQDLMKLTQAPVITYGFKEGCHVRAEAVRSGKEGIRANLITPLGDVAIQSSLIGDFNIYNILAASAGALCMDINLEAISVGIEQLKGVPGRLELINSRYPCPVVVDYAHTPDALRKALEAVTPLVEGRLITVFGCGGDRDTGKRKEMGRVAGELSDLVFITSDNPRTEDPAAIAAAIETGVRETGLANLEKHNRNFSLGIEANRVAEKSRLITGYMVDLDRRHAIWKAMGMGDEKDLILIAGKGHEDYQVIGKERRHFDDREVVREFSFEEV